MTTKDILKWIGTILTIILFIVLIQKQDWQKILLAFKSISFLTILIVWLLFFIRIWINSFRWFIILNIAQIKIPLKDSIKLFFLGMFISNFLPSTIGGDGIKYLALLKFERDKTIAFSSIVIDRLVNVFAMLCLLPISFIVLYENHINFTDVKRLLGTIFLPLQNKIKHWFESGKDWIRKNMFWFKSPKQLLASVVVSWIAVAAYFLGIWLIAQDLGMGVKYIEVGGIGVLTYLITLLPISINGYGVREVAITSIYSAFGFSIESAISLAIISRLIYLTTTLPGAIWLPENISYLSKKITNNKP